MVEDLTPVVGDYGINCLITMDSPNTNGLTAVECFYVTIDSDETIYQRWRMVESFDIIVHSNGNEKGSWNFTIKVPVKEAPFVTYPVSSS